MSDQTPILGGSHSDEEAAMRRGKGGTLLLMGALAIALIAGLAILMSGGDEARVYREIGKRINGLKQEGFDSFWGCALEATDLRDVRTNADLAFQLDIRGVERGRAYGLHLRGKCLPRLKHVGPELETLIVPDDLRSDVSALKEANAKLRTATSDFVAYLDDPELHYDADKALPLIQQITRAWFDFKTAHGALNKTLKARLQ